MTGVELDLIEARYDRAYDEQTPSTVHVMRGGTLTRAATFHRGLCVALVRAVLDR